jgi:hypothetical protein
VGEREGYPDEEGSPVEGEAKEEALFEKCAALLAA